MRKWKERIRKGGSKLISARTERRREKSPGNENRIMSREGDMKENSRRSESRVMDGNGIMNSAFHLTVKSESE